MHFFSVAIFYAAQTRLNVRTRWEKVYSTPLEVERLFSDSVRLESGCEVSRFHGQGVESFNFPQSSCRRPGVPVKKLVAERARPAS